MNVFDQSFLDSLEASVAPTAAAVTLPAACYSDPDWFAWEKATIFESEWLCVGRADRAAEPGDWYSTQLLDEPLLVVRGKDGDIRVLSAVCQHRAMTVAEGSGTCSTFTCRTTTGSTASTAGCSAPRRCTAPRSSTRPASD